MLTVLGVDIGTTGMKMGVFHRERDDLELIEQFSQGYTLHTYNNGLFSDLDPAKWQDAFRRGCTALANHMADINAVALSGTTPGMTAMAADGAALYPAIPMLDQRSREQAKRIIDTIGLDTILAETGNMPVAGGCSLASILWLRDNEPDVFANTAVFGHSNTFMAKWLTGEFAIDPSSASLTALYNLVKNDLTWNIDIADAFDLPPDRLPRLMAAHESPGRVTSGMAREFGLTRKPPVIIGGNDAVLAAYSVGITEPGDIINVNGTCEITLVCLPECYGSTSYNVRAHVIPGRWLTLYVMNADGKAIDWFRGMFCSEMDDDTFFADFIPRSLNSWIGRKSAVEYVPFLLGSRYSLEPLKAAFTGLTPETTREECMAALFRGLAEYQKAHLDDIGEKVGLSDVIHITGGAMTDAIIRGKRAWMRDCEYVPEEQSSMKGAAMLGVMWLEGSR